MSNARELAELSGSYGTGGFVGMKNRIINGAMAIDQRNAGASITPADTQYMVDRFAYNGTQASKFTAQQVSTAPAGFINSLKMTVASAVSVGASDFFAVVQKLEGLNVADFGWGTANAQTVTLSFQVYSSLTGTFGGALENSAANRCYPFSYTVSSANTWTTVSVTIAGDTSGTWTTSNTTGLAIRWSLGTGSTYSGTAGSWGSTRYFSVTGATSVVGTSGATFYITGVQLEKGSTATSFDYRPYGTELALCQRYYQKQLGNFVGWARMYATGSGATFGQTLVYPVPMRAAPTGAIIGTWAAINTGAPGFSSFIYFDSAFISGSSTAAGDTVIYSNSSTNGYSLTSEL